MKKIFAISLLIVLPFVFLPAEITLSETAIEATIETTIETTNPLTGKIIALDAGHGGTELGATYPSNAGEAGKVYEKDVNLAVVYTLKQKLEGAGAGATVVLTRLCDETITSRKERVDWAVEQCKKIVGRKCDALVSVHHNGSTDTSHDGMLVIYNEKQDVPLATTLHDALWAKLAYDGFIDEGYDRGGYGMTVYNHLVSALTEAYYITNNKEAEWYLAGTPTTVCTNEDGSEYKVLIGDIGDRINQEADALYQGLYNYFFSNPPTKPPRK